MVQNDTEKLLVAKQWKTTNLFALDTLQQHYTLLPQNMEGPRFDYGNHLVFEKYGQFYSYYSAPCGLDCFRTVKGNYKVYDNTLHIKVLSISFHGTCSKPEELPNYQMKFFISKTENGFQLDLQT